MLSAVSVTYGVALVTAVAKGAVAIDVSPLTKYMLLPGVIMASMLSMTPNFAIWYVEKVAAERFGVVGAT